jgi:hypothetical protein
VRRLRQRRRQRGVSDARRVPGAAPSNPSKPPAARRTALTGKAEAATSDPCGELSAGSSRQENAGDEQAACTIWSTVREFGSKDRPGPERRDRPHADAHKAHRGTPARQTYNGDSARRPAQHCSHAAIIHASAPAPSPRAPWPSPATLASCPRPPPPAPRCSNTKVISWLPMACVITL